MNDECLIFWLNDQMHLENSKVGLKNSSIFFPKEWEQ